MYNKTISLKIKRSLFLAFSLTILLSTSYSCSKTPTAACPNAKAATLHNFTGLDGCGWVITLAEGTNLEPLNLGDFVPNPTENQKIWVAYSTMSSAASFCMVGEIVSINCLSNR